MNKFNFNKCLNEELSISDEVLTETNNISLLIKNDINTKIPQREFVGDVVDGNFKYNFFGKEFNINYRCYINITNVFYLKDLVSTTYLDRNIVDFNLSLIRDDLFFDGPISHEVLHIFQYTKNKHDYLQYSYFSKLYNAARNIKKHYNEYNDTEINFAKALYASFPFEQDAMTHCYYTNLFKVNIYAIQIVKDDLDEYKFLETIQTAINNIDLFDESLFNNIISKQKFLIRLQKSYKRFKLKLNNAVKKVYKDKENIMKDLNISEGLI